MLLEGSQLGYYRLIRQIGSGGMGEIYLAEDTRIRRQVAIKVVRNESLSYPDTAATQESSRLFQREMQAVVSLDNPHILTILDFGEETLNRVPTTYMVMPYRQEGSLNDWLSTRTEKLTQDDVNSIIQQAADALQNAHDHGVIHQDVKPSNFLVRSKKDTPNQPDLLLADFGIAKMLSATSTASQTARGTAAFMPPEQWDGNPVPATDQYALAIMAYLLLTGQTPFRGRMEQVMRQQFMTDPQPPSKLNSEIPADVDTVILHALAKKPEERFASVSNFANAFEQALHYTKQSPSSQPIPEPTVHDASLHTPVVETLEPPVLTSEPVVPTSDTLEPTVPVSDTPPPSIVEKPINTPAPPLPPPVRPSSRTRTFGLVALALLVVLGSIIGFGTYQNHISQVNADATASAYYADSQNATATSQAVDQANATATVQDGLDATATVVAANPYPSYLGGQNGTLALFDSLDHSSSWEANSNCQFVSGAYHISESQTNHFDPCYEASKFRNFAFEVQMTIIQGDCGGILFRADSSSGNYYYYEVCENNQYGLFEYTNGNGSVLSSGNSDSVNLGHNASNTIAVVVEGTIIALYVNGHSIVFKGDSSYPDGSLALFASENTNTTEVAFSNARVWTF